MLIGVVGAPNKGKSTLFSAATLVDAGIANYPFTTITPNKGITYVRSECPHKLLGLEKCNAKNSKCINGTRLVPVNMVDVPGLVPDAHQGKGLGNRFLDSVREADALIQVVDSTGKTDLHGNPCQKCLPSEEIGFLQEEIALWLCSIMLRKPPKEDNIKGIVESLSGLRITEHMLLQAASECGLDITSGLPGKEGTEQLAREILKLRMPTVVACNKIDLPEAGKIFKKVKEQSSKPVFACSAAIELALRKAAEKGLCSYFPGAKEFDILGEPSQKQVQALERMREFLTENNGTGVQEIIDYVVYKKLGCVVVYPVEDERKFSNRKGEVLPDALLVPKGTTALQLAELVHTDLAQKFVGAIDAKSHMKIGADYVLNDGDVIKILASR